MNIQVIKEKCIGCGLCFRICPEDAFYFEPYEGNKMKKVAAIGPSCNNCNQCLSHCKFEALKVRMDENKDILFEDESQVRVEQKPNEHILCLNSENIIGKGQHGDCESHGCHL